MDDEKMSSVAAPEDAFVTELDRFSANQLMLLRQATGRPLGQNVAVYDLFCSVFRPIRSKAPMRKWPCYLVATLYPWNPAEKGKDSFATNLRQVAAPLQGSGRNGADQRFSALLAAKGKDLKARLTQAVKFLRRRQIAIDWRQFLHDLSRWYEPGQPTQLAWANDYFC